MSAKIQKTVSPEEKILGELQSIKELLKQLYTNQPRRIMMRVPEAARLLGMSTQTLRKLIKDGTIPARCVNPGAKSQHFIINIEQAQDTLSK